jgi:hypothetical protein
MTKATVRAGNGRTVDPRALGQGGVKKTPQQKLLEFQKAPAW